MISGLLPLGGVGILAGAPKVGKSGIALNAGLAVSRGEPFLGEFPTTKGRAAYIQTEIPSWALAERLRLVGGLSEDFLVCNPGQLHLNFYEDRGLKRVETGGRDRVASLIEALRAQSVSFVIFDPLSHFHSLNENSVEDMSHLFEIFRGIARAARCSVLCVHHHRKVARSPVAYQGAEDLRGSIALYAEVDAALSIYGVDRQDGTRRFKLLASTRHAEDPEPLELIRLGGDNAWRWRAETWVDTSKVDQSLRVREAIIEALDDGAKSVESLETLTGKSKPTLYRHLRALQKDGQIGKEGSLFLIRGGRA